jgi:hypothetical protein
MDSKRFPELLKAIYDAVDGLEEMFPGRHFTPDGHMIGSIGEALASYHYGVVLAGASAECHDGVCGDREVQVKATQVGKVAISSEPEHLLVLRIARDGTFTVEYNGSGALVWALVKDKKRPKTGQYHVQLSTLRRLMVDVPPSLRLEQVVHPGR